jgi:hypothetical protein
MMHVWKIRVGIKPKSPKDVVDAWARDKFLALCVGMRKWS